MDADSNGALVRSLLELCVVVRELIESCLAGDRERARSVV